MAKGETTYLVVDAELEWAKVFEFNRDMGSPEYPKRETDGEYCVNLIIDEETKDTLIAAGVPTERNGYKQFHPKEDGKFMWKAKRPHRNQYIQDKNTGENLLMGPPDVFLFNESLAAMEAAGSTDFEAYRIDLDPEEHGLISNGSEGKVKLSIYKNGSRTSVRLERIALTKHVPYFDQAKEARVSVEGGVAI